MTKSEIIQHIRIEERKKWRMVQIMKGMKSEDLYTGEWLALHNLLMKLDVPLLTREEEEAL